MWQGAGIEFCDVPKGSHAYRLGTECKCEGPHIFAPHADVHYKPCNPRLFTLLYTKCTLHPVAIWQFDPAVRPTWHPAPPKIFDYNIPGLEFKSQVSLRRPGGA